MAPKFLKTVTLVLALATFVGSATLSVHVPTAYASTGSGGSCTNGDPDSPKDTAPKQSAAQTSVMSGAVKAAPLTSRGSVVRWLMVQNIMMFGAPGLMR